LNLKTGQLTVALASPNFVNPTYITWLDERQANRLLLRTH
jgi:hypothetical protein